MSKLLLKLSLSDLRQALGPVTAREQVASTHFIEAPQVTLWLKRHVQLGLLHLLLQVS